MRLDDLDAQWRELAEAAITGMAEWRVQHPTATFREIEAAVDERLARVRARMLQDAALASAAPTCAPCRRRSARSARTAAAGWRRAATRRAG